MHEQSVAINDGVTGHQVLQPGMTIQLTQNESHEGRHANYLWHYSLAAFGPSEVDKDADPALPCWDDVEMYCRIAVPSEGTTVL